jgi:hypothetical protein
MMFEYCDLSLPLPLPKQSQEAADHLGAGGYGVSLWLSTHLQRAQPDISGLLHLLCCEEAPCDTAYDPIMTFVGAYYRTLHTQGEKCL